MNSMNCSVMGISIFDFYFAVFDSRELEAIFDSKRLPLINLTQVPPRRRDCTQGKKETQRYRFYEPNHFAVRLFLRNLI